jgi:uncharacterized protein (TIGR00304 family)
MLGLRRISFAVFAAGIGLLAYSVASGESQVNLVVIFPVVTAGGGIGLAGMGLVFLAFFVGFVSFARTSTSVASSPQEASPPSPASMAAAPPPKIGGIVFVGPIPIVFGSNVRISKAMLVLAVVMTLVLLAFFILVLARA